MFICGFTFLLQQLAANAGLGYDLNNLLALHSIYSEHFSIYQLITYAFLHADLSHILLNLLGLWVFGTRIELLVGSRLFVQFVLIATVGSAVFHVTYLFFSQRELYAIAQYNPNLYQSLNVPTMGISGVVYACMAAFAYLYPRDYVYVYFLIPIQVKWLVMILLGYEVIDLIRQLTLSMDGELQVAHFAHLGGAFFGFAWAYLLQGRPKKF